LESRKGGRLAVRLRLSGLLPFNRREQHLNAAREGFVQLSDERKGQLFVLANADLFFFFSKEVEGLVRSEIMRVRFLFADDPIVAKASDADAFVSWFAIDRDYDALVRAARGLSDRVAAAPAALGRDGARADLLARQKASSSLTPELLDRIEAGLVQADLSSLLRRHAICNVQSETSLEQKFVEWTVSISDLAQTMLPHFDFASDPLLFQHLTESLDRRMLALLAKPGGPLEGGDISVNLNVATLLSEHFFAFDEKLFTARRGCIVIELKLEDIAQDPESYEFARKLAQSKGYRLCLDGLTLWTLGLVDRGQLGLDFLKLHFDALMLVDAAERRAWLENAVARTGPAHFILSHVEGAEGVAFGRAAGVQLFQGRHIERLLAEARQRRQYVRLNRRGSGDT
jgi:hypothetical protein